MDINSAYLKIKDRSVLGLLDGKEVEALLKSSELQDVPAGGSPARGPGPTDVFIVVDGEIVLRGGRGQSGRVISGRAIELQTYFLGESAWRFEWVAEKPTTMLRFPRAVFDQSLIARPELRAYLERITIYPELQRLKNDLRLFGFNNQELYLTFNSLALVPFKGVNLAALKKKEAATERHFVVVNRGEVGFSVSFNDQLKSVGRFATGEYFIMARDRQELKVDAAPQTHIWVLPVGSWAQRLPGPKVQSFLQLIDPVAERLEQVTPVKAKKKVQPEIVLEEEPQGGPTIEDFKVSPQRKAEIESIKPVIVRQRDEMDCGAACLATIAKFYGRNISLPAYRSLVHVTRNGASMLSLKKAAEKTGFKTIGIMSGYKGLLELRTPFIALTQYHFIVVYRVTEKGVFAGDPAGGLVTIPVEKFEKQWSKNALLLKPTDAFLSYPETQASWKKYGLIFDGFRRNILELFLATLLLFVFGVMAPLFIQFIFDGVLTSKDPTVLIALFGSMVLINTLATMTTWARGMIMNNVAAQIDGKFSALFLGHTLHLPLNFFSVRRVGDITTRLSEVAKIRDFVTNKTLTLATNVLSVFAYGLVLSLFNYQLILVVGVLLPILVLFISKAVPKMNKINLNIYKIEAKLKSSTYEIFHGLETIKSLAGTIAARWRWEAGFIEYMTCNFRTNRISRTIAGASELFKNLITVGVLLMAVYLYIENKLSLGQVVAVNMIIGSLLRPAIAIASDTRSISMIGLSLSRVDDLITAAVEPDVRGGQYAEMKVQGAVEFRGVTFQYGSELSPVVLDGVSLKIEAGQTVAFVGPSGSGKTTLSLMVNLLYFPTKGQILIDGIDATLIPLRTLRRQVAMIMQENGLFSGSVLDNIALGDSQPSFARAMHAARLADAHDFIGKLSEGYSTNLGESGVGLSGGQRQRINIARALYLDPPILIMDEATSALDALSEQAIVKNIKERQQKRTTVIIAHRLNTVMHADKIYVMNAGKLVESGTHAELLAAQGFYFDLFRKQINM